MTFRKFGNCSQKSAQPSDETVPFLVRRQDEEVGLHKIKRASFAGSVFNLSCTIVGAGIMSLPAALKVLGVIPGVLLIIIAGFLAEVSIELLIRFSNEAAAFSYADLMESAFGTVGKALLQITVIFNNIGMLIIYLIIIEDVLSGSTSSGVHYSGVLGEWLGEHWWTGRAFVLIVLTLIVLIPVTSLKRIDSLKYTSALSVAMACVFIVIVVGVTAYKLTKGTIKKTTWAPSISSLSAFFNLFTAVPVLVVAFLCHFNVHTIKNELEQASQMQTVVKTSLALCGALYIMTGLFGFLLFGDSTASDILSNFDSDLGIPYSYVFNDIVRASYAAHVILVFPVIFHPLRLNFDGLVSPSAGPLASDNLRFALMTVGLLTVIVLGAIFVPSIWAAFEFTGATAGALLLFIFPASIALKDPYGIATKKDKILSVSLIVIAVFSDLMAIYSNASSLF